jgi:hypothetical protein
MTPQIWGHIGKVRPFGKVAFPVDSRPAIWEIVNRSRFSQSPTYLRPSSLPAWGSWSFWAYAAGYDFDRLAPAERSVSFIWRFVASAVRHRYR